MGGDVGLGDVAWARTGGMYEGATCSARPVHNLFRQNLIAVAVVGIFVAEDFDDTGPPPADADDLVTLAQSPYGHRPDGGIQARNIAAAGQNANNAFGFRILCHST